MIKACGMKLQKFHIGHTGSCTISHGDSVSCGPVPIGSVEINFSGATCGENCYSSQESPNFICHCVENVGAQTLWLTNSRRINFLIKNKINGHLMFDDFNFGICTTCANKSLFYGSSRRI